MIRVRMPATSLLSTVLPIVLATALPANAADATFRKYESTVGGFSVDIPMGWHTIEESGPGNYRVSLSRERVEKKGDLFTYGLTVSRVRDRFAEMPALPRNASDAATTFANNLASQFPGGQTFVIDGGYDSTYGMKLRYFHVMASLGTPECLQLRVLIGTKGAEWFSAMWEVPCDEFQSADKDLRRMRESLRVEKKWGDERDDSAR